MRYVMMVKAMMTRQVAQELRVIIDDDDECIGVQPLQTILNILQEDGLLTTWYSESCIALHDIPEI